MPLISPCIIEGLRQKVRQIGEADVDLCSFVFRRRFSSNIKRLGGVGHVLWCSWEVVQNCSMISRGYTDPEPSGTWGVLNSGIWLSLNVPGGWIYLAILYVFISLLCCPYCSYSIRSKVLKVNHYLQKLFQWFQWLSKKDSLVISRGYTAPEFRPSGA